MNNSLNEKKRNNKEIFAINIKVNPLSLSQAFLSEYDMTTCLVSTDYQPHTFFIFFFKVKKVIVCISLKNILCQFSSSKFHC